MNPTVSATKQDSNGTWQNTLSNGQVITSANPNSIYAVSPSNVNPSTQYMMGPAPTVVSNETKKTQVTDMMNQAKQLSQSRGQTTNGEVTQNADGSVVQDNYQDPVLPPNSSPIYGSVNGQPNRIIGYNEADLATGAKIPTYFDSNSDTPAESPEEQAYNKILDQMKATTDANTARTIASIQQKSALLKEQQKQINAAQQAGTRTALLMGGVTGQGSSAQYAPISSENIVAAQMNYGVQQLAALDAQEQDLINEAQIAGDTQNFKLLEKKLALAEAKREEKAKVAEELNKKIMEQNEKARERIMQASRDNALADLYDQGVTDPKELLKLLNGSGGDFTLKEVREGVANMATSAEEKAERTAVQGLMKSISEKGNATPAQIAYLMKNATTVDDFYALGGGQFLADEDTKFIEMPDGTTVMVNAKTGEEIKTYGNKPTGSSGVNENALTYARQFATTGTMPSLTDLQKMGTTPAEITRMAKELPKQPGEIVSTQTGVKNTSIAAAAQDDFVRLYNITKNIEKLKELDKKRWGGLVAGSVGKVLGSDDQAAYLTARKAIVDDLSRMQSGAALTAEEVAYYEDYLPGRFSEFLGFGQDSGAKINNFETQMNNKLKNALNSNGLSIYGYSTVNLGGKEYKVGEEIEVNGVKGRVLSDGTISTQESGPISMNSGVVGGYDIASYATDPNHEKRVATIYSKTSNLSTPEQIDSYIKSVAPNSPVKAQDVIDAANATGTDPGMILAIMQQDSTFGTQGKAVRTLNPGNVGNTDSGATQSFPSWKDGVLAVAKNLSKRKVA